LRYFLEKLWWFAFAVDRWLFPTDVLNWLGNWLSAGVWFFGFSLKEIEFSIADAIWSGIGVIARSILGATIFT
jgi:hypothetical protein